CQPPGEHVMSHPAIGVAAMPGAPIGSFVVNLAPVLAPVGMALLVLAVLGAIVLLVGRDAHHPAAPGCRRAEVAGGERPSSSASRPGAGLIARSSSTAALWHGPVRPARHLPAMPRGLPKAIGPRVHRHRLLPDQAQRLDRGQGSPHPTRPAAIGRESTTSTPARTRTR